MDFDLSADQEALREAAADLLEGKAPLERVRARVGPGTVVGTLPGAPGAADGSPAAADAPAGYDDELWAAMADQGWLAVERPEAEGGLGLTMVEVAVLCEQVGRRVAPAPFAETVLVLGALADAPHDSLAELTARLAEGGAVGAVAWCPAAGALRADGSGDTCTLSGTTPPVLYAPSADVAVVATPEAVFAVGLAADDRPRPEPAMDRTRELAPLTFDRAPAVRLGGAEAADRLVDRAATATSAELLGLCDHVLALSVAYAKDRVQFGKPIGSFQAIKHRLADALVDVEGMRSTAYYAAWCTATGHVDADVAASMAKIWCAEASRRVMAAGLQVHGGIGFTWEHELHLYVKRAQLDQVAYGDAGAHRDRLARLLRRRLAEGRGVL